MGFLSKERGRVFKDPFAIEYEDDR
jgi:hypothetical protein